MFKKGDKVRLKGGVNQDTRFDYPDREMVVRHIYEKTQLCDIFEETEGLSQPVYFSDIELVGEGKEA